jgi:RNA recognition motif-containing protein
MQKFSYSFRCQVDPKRAVPQESDGLIAKIFVGGIPVDVDNETLAHYFTSYGVVLDAALMMDRVTGRYRTYLPSTLTPPPSRSRGFGFVTFDDYSCVEACLDAQRREPLRMRGKKVDCTYRYMLLIFMHFPIVD